MRRQTNASLLQAEQAAQQQQQPTHEGQQLREHAGISYVLVPPSDAQLLNGRFPQKKISELVKLAEGRDYLGMVWRSANSELKNVIKHHFTQKP